MPGAAWAVAGLANNGARAGSVGTHKEWRWDVSETLRLGWFSE